MVRVRSGREACARYAIEIATSQLPRRRTSRSVAMYPRTRACPPEPCAQVRILPGALRMECLKTPPSASSLRTGSCRMCRRVPPEAAVCQWSRNGDVMILVPLLAVHRPFSRPPEHGYAIHHRHGGSEPNPEGCRYRRSLTCGSRVTGTVVVTEAARYLPTTTDAGQRAVF